MGDRKPPPPPPPERQCKAKTRDGDPCKNWGMRNGRCRMHGGKSPSGIGSPRYVHGWYSTHPIDTIRRAAILRQIEQERRLTERIEELKKAGDWPELTKHRK